MTATLVVDDVTFRRDGRLLLDSVSLSVGAGEHWALLGANGAGKSTLLSMCGARQHPTSGTVHVLGHRLGRVDMRELRTHIGHVDPRTRIEPAATAFEAVLTGLTASSDILKRHSATDDDETRGRDLLRTLGVDHRSDTAWVHLSQGERGRVLIARALITEPSLLLLDEPSTGLDLAARELLLRAVSRLSSEIPGLSSVHVTHHLEELPVTTTHAALLREGGLTAAGPVEEVITDANLTAAFGLPIGVRCEAGRWTARAV